jgi:hypothetical protein
MSFGGDDIVDAYGGFHDLATFRAETGLTSAEVPDSDAWTAINGDLLEQKRIAERDRAQSLAKMNEEKNRLQEERNRLSSEISNAKSAKSNAENQLEYERNRRNNSWGTVSILDPYRSSSSLSDYIAKEKIKQELKEEMQNEKVLKKLLNNKSGSARKPRAKSKTKVKVIVKTIRVKSRSKSKGKKKK